MGLGLDWFLAGWGGVSAQGEVGVQGVRVEVEEGVLVEVEIEEVETVGVEEGWEVKFSSRDQYHMMETVCEVELRWRGGVGWCRMR